MRGLPVGDRMTDPEKSIGQEAVGDDGAELRLLRLAGPRRTAPHEREARVRAAVHAHWQLHLSARRWSSWWWVAASLTAAATIVGVVLLRTFEPTVTTTGMAVVEVLSGDVLATSGSETATPSLGAELGDGTVVETAAEGRLALRLPGGSSLRIDGGSRTVLEAANIIRLDRGAVYLDSEPGSSSGGVVVRCDLAEVREDGTQFEVRILGDGLRVRTREGVALLWTSGREERIAAGTEATLGADGSLSRKVLTAYGPEWEWVTSTAPVFSLDGRSGAEFLRWVSRETGRELRWTDPGLAAAAERAVLHGNISGVRPEEAPSMVLPTCGLSATVDGGFLVIAAAGR